MADQPAIPTTAVEVTNHAMTRIGAIPIQSFDTPGPAGVAPQLTYNGVLLSLMSEYPWHFSMTTMQLAQHENAPERGWTFQYTLPPDRVALPRAYYDSKDTAYNRQGGLSLRHFELSENLVLTDAASLWANYQRFPAVAHWPGYFVELAVLAVAAELALVIREDRTLRRDLRRDAFGPPEFRGQGGLMAVAMAMDAQAAPVPQIDSGRNPVHDAGYLPGDAREGWDDW